MSEIQNMFTQQMNMNNIQQGQPLQQNYGLVINRYPNMN